MDDDWIKVLERWALVIWIVALCLTGSLLALGFDYLIRMGLL